MQIRLKFKSISKIIENLTEKYFSKARIRSIIKLLNKYFCIGLANLKKRLTKLVCFGILILENKNSEEFIYGKCKSGN